MLSQQFANISYGEQSASLIGGIFMEILKYVPGFRSGQTWKKVVASIFYAFAIIVGFADGFGSFLLMVGIFLFACSIVDLILHGFRKKKDTPIKQAIILLIVAFALMIAGGGLVSPNEDAKVAEAEALYDQAEAYINEGKIDEALKAIDRSKQLNPNKEQNKAFWLEEKIQKLNSDDFMKETLVNMSDADFNLLINGELKTVIIDHEELNSMFLNKLAENADKRAEYLAEIAEQKRIAEEEAEKKRQEEAEKKRLAEKEAEKKKQEEAAAKRKEMIEKQFSLWDGSHIGLTEVIKEGMHDPKSYKHVETVYWDMEDHLVVQTTFRGKNAFGGVVKNIVKAKVSLDGDVLEIIDQY